MEMLTEYGHPDVALFSKGHAADELREIYITAPDLHVVEALSPGEWEDAETPSGEGVVLLAGSAGAWEHLGVEKPTFG
jgi:hypothetical protein